MTGNLFPARRTAILSAAIALFASSIATAQTAGAPTASAGSTSGLVWSVDFAQRVTGRHLIITTVDGRQDEGIVRVSPTGLETAGMNPGAAVPFNKIVRIEKPTYRMRTWAWVGAAAGATIGAVSYCAANNYCNEEPYWIFMGMIGAGIGAGAGGGLGAVLNHVHRNADILYDANRRTKTVAVAPILSPTRKGVALRVTWR